MNQKPDNMFRLWAKPRLSKATSTSGDVAMDDYIDSLPGAEYTAIQDYDGLTLDSR